MGETLETVIPGLQSIGPARAAMWRGICGLSGEAFPKGAMIRMVLSPGAAEPRPVTDALVAALGFEFIFATGWVSPWCVALGQRGLSLDPLIEALRCEQGWAPPIVPGRPDPAAPVSAVVILRGRAGAPPRTATLWRSARAFYIDDELTDLEKLQAQLRRDGIAYRVQRCAQRRGTAAERIADLRRGMPWEKTSARGSERRAA